MRSRTRVPRWTPPLREAIRLAWRPALAYLVFTALGSFVLLLTVAFYSRGNANDFLILLLGLGAGMAGVVLGQFLSILRLRALPIFVITFVCMIGATWIMALTSPPEILIALFFFLFAFPCGLLWLMHRWELFATFWPAVGWIGSALVIINEHGRIHVWEQSKVRAWLPVPLVFLALFLVLWLVYLAAKQAARVEMWQALSGAAARRIAKKEEKRKNAVSALPRRNLLALLTVAAILFAVTAVLAPYLWRTGKGDKESHHQETSEPREPSRTPNVDLEGVVQQMQKIANAAKDTLPKLWPLLLLFLLYRPAKRALLLAHLKAPLVPTPPSERIDNLWEYIRIAAEDAGVVPTSADSVEQLLSRVPKERISPELVRCAEIYVRTRYGFVVQRGDAAAMREQVGEAAAVLRRGIGPWKRLTNLWRPLA